MSETANTAKLAEIVSNNIFRWLKWGASPIRDIDWECVSPNHNKITHPSDVVFYYEHPYSGKTIYINTDLKSYKTNSITTSGVRSSLKSLAMAIDCALISDSWQNKFLHDKSDWDVVGLLFIFNHDGNYHKDFMSLLNGITPESLDIQKNQKIAVFGPETINYLINTVDDLRLVVQDKRANDESSYDFYYPNMVENKKHYLNSYPATVELILSPFMIVKFNGNNEKDYVIYYREKGDTIDEFTYLIDTLLTYQILTPENNIEIVFYNSSNDNNAMVNFNNAKASYAKSWGLTSHDDHFKVITTRVMSIKSHHYDPVNERIRDE